MISRSQYIVGIATIIYVTFALPIWVIDAFKVYVVSVVVIVSMFWSILFHSQKLREIIIRRLLADLMVELFKEDVFKEYLTKKFQEKYFSDKK